MTANISQHVLPRRPLNTSFVPGLSARGSWQARQPLVGFRPIATALGLRRAWPTANRTFFSQQRGSVTQSTVTVTFSVASFLLVAVLGFFYLQQVFSTAAEGSDMQALESQIGELHERQRALELEGAQLRSIQAVEDRVNKLNLVAVDRVAYLASTPDKVALRTE